MRTIRGTKIVVLMLCGVLTFWGCMGHGNSAGGGDEKALATAKAEYLKGRDYDKNWQMRIAEHYYRKAYEGFGAASAQDQFEYADAGYRWAYLRYARGDTEGALSVVSDLLAQTKENEAFPKKVEVALLMLMADCQLNLHQVNDAQHNWQKAYEVQQELLKKGKKQKVGLPFVPMSISINLYSIGDIKGAQKWMECCSREFELYEKQGDSLLIEEWKGHIALKQALYLQASGHASEAAAVFAAVPKSRIFEPRAYTEAAEYLMAAGRYDEAAYWYEQLDSTYMATDGAQMTFDNIAERLSPRYLAYRKAGRNADALAIADSISAAVDSALVWQKKNDAAELAVIYQTHERDLQLKDLRFTVSLHRIIVIAAVLIILLIGYLLWRSYRYNKILASKNRRLLADIELREREEKQAVEQLKAEPEETLTGEQQLLRRICDLMDGPDHIYTDAALSRTQLSQMLGTNEHYITDAISTCCNGKTLNAFLNEYRLRYAAHLLSTTDESVSVIAELSGFARSSFFRTFVDSYGMSPAEYRRATK